jgi:hypothetical protein
MSQQDEYGYELYCINCGELTTQASWGYNYTTGKLGNSYCEKCEIRFSKSEGLWMCCKLSEEPIGYEYYFCSNKVNKGLVCDKDHSKTMKIEFTRVEKSINYPYKKSINITYVKI